MKIVRSWPSVIPADRCYVVDTLPKFIMTDFDYRGLGDLDDDVLLLEWDIAIDREGLEAFLEQIAAEPDRVHAAPYRIYTSTTRAENLRQPVWVPRRYNDGEQSMSHVTEGDAACHTFGLGMTYMPRLIIRDFLDDWPGHFSDMSFAGWHYKNVTKEVPIPWDVRPIHLHYLIERY